MIKLEKNLKFQKICANHPAFQFPIVLPLELLKFVQELVLDAFGSARAEAEGDDFVAVVISIGHDGSGVMALLSCEAVGEGGEDAVVRCRVCRKQLVVSSSVAREAELASRSLSRCVCRLMRRS